MKAVFWGTDEIALPLLEVLLLSEGIELIGVISQPNRPHGRGQKVQINSIVQWAIQHGIEALQPEKPSNELATWLKSKGVELGIVMAYGHILPGNILELPKFGTWNIHTSLLPCWRGAAPITYSILNGERETGVTFMKMVQKMDAGPILKQMKIEISAQDTTKTLREKLSFASAEVARECIPLLASQQFALLEQNEAEATYTKKIKKEDGCLNFFLPAEQLERQIRAFTPWPGSYFYYGNSRIKVGAAVLEKNFNDDITSAEPGTVLGTVLGGLRVKTGNGNLILSYFQKEGGKMLPAEDFLRGFSLPKGCILETSSCFQKIKPHFE